ncbi:MAG: hypothetical protein K0U84_19130, partial [Actinomycetia bacterium]|nr:hypothetical protein [Actinomycetes bacterium]
DGNTRLSGFVGLVGSMWLTLQTAAACAEQSPGVNAFGSALAGVAMAIAGAARQAPTRPSIFNIVKPLTFSLLAAHARLRNIGAPFGA